MIPVHNEAELLPAIWRSVEAEFGGLDVEYIFVDDASVDGSREFLQTLAHHPKVKIIQNDRRQGKGLALRNAFKVSTGNFIAFQDADLEYQPTDLKRLFITAQENPGKVIFGKRITTEITNGFLRGQEFLNRCISFFSSMLGGAQLDDVACCYKVFEREHLENFAWKSVGFEIDVELAAFVGHAELPWIQCPVSFTARNHAQGKKLRWTQGFLIALRAIQFNLIYFFKYFKFRKLVAVSALLAGYIALVSWLGLVKGADPDFYFHLALAKLGAETNSLVKSLPQVEDLGWKWAYPNKEFLFHLWNVILWKIGSAQAVLIGVLLIASMQLISLCNHHFKKHQVSIAVLLTAIPCFGVSAYFFRISLLRPHNLAILFFIIIITGILENRPRRVFAGSMFFTLAYHTFYLPMILFGIFRFFGKASAHDLRKIGRSLFAGIAIGLVINPYFPLQIEMTWNHFLLGIGAVNLEKMGVGLESIPLRSDVLFKTEFAVLVGLAIALWLLLHLPNRNRRQFDFLFVSTISFGILSLLSPRILEYLIPLLSLLLGETLVLARDQTFEIQQKFKRLLIGACLVTLPLLASSQYQKHQTTLSSSAEQQQFEFQKLLLSVPSHSKILNCDWEHGARILFARPDLRFVDLLDPTFLYYHNPELHFLRLKALTADDATFLEISRNLFDADYFLCSLNSAVTFNRQPDALDQSRMVARSGDWYLEKLK